MISIYIIKKFYKKYQYFFFQFNRRTSTQINLSFIKLIFDRKIADQKLYLTNKN